MSKIMPEHLARAAFVDVRQSTAYQVVNNLESQRRQYGAARIRETIGGDLRRQSRRGCVAGGFPPGTKRA